jgi:hypothetical protein
MKEGYKKFETFFCDIVRDSPLALYGDLLVDCYTSRISNLWASITCFLKSLSSEFRGNGFTTFEHAVFVILDEIKKISILWAHLHQ